MPNRLAVPLLCCALVLAACDGGSAPKTPARISVVSGNNQTGGVTENLPSPVVVEVSDDTGNPVRGAVVAWSPMDGAATQTSGETDRNGRAQVNWSLGQRAGENRLMASAGAVEVVVTATARPGAPAALAPAGGSAQSGTVGQQLVQALAVRVADRFDNPVPNVTVTFVPATGNGSVAGATATDAQGVAQARWTLGSRPGEQFVDAAVAGVAGAAVRFSAIAAVGPPAAVVAVSAVSQVGVVNQVMPPVTVRVEDALGNPVPNAAVNFTATGGGTFTPATVVTGGTGVAQATWRLGQAAGTQTASATVGTVPATQFTATVQPGPAAALQRVSPATVAGTVGQPLAAPIVVRAVDAFANPVAGVQVSFAATAGSGTLQPAVATTDAQGQAQAAWTLGTVPGQHTVMATAAAVPGAQAAFTATAAAGAPATIALTPQAPVLNAIGQTVQLSATVRDALGNVLNGAGVAWSSSAPAVASVNGTGLVQAVAGGSAVITAAAGAASANVTVQVVQSQSLVLNVAGLPAGTPAAITVTGPGYSQNVTAAATLSLPVAGTYTVTASPVTSGGTTYTPTPSTQGVTITPGGAGSATVTYAGGVPTLTSGVPVTGLAGALGSTRHFRIAVPAGATSLTVATTGASSDLDLYVRRGAQATLQSYDCRPFSASGNETCTMPSPIAGDWYVMLHGFEAYSGVTLTATTNTGPSTGTLNLSVIGLPGGTNAAVNVTGAGYSNNFTSSQTVALQPGTYTVTASSVTSGGIGYTPTPASQNVSIAAGATTNATVTYAGGVPLLTSGVPLTGLSGALNSERHFRIAVPAGATSLRVVTGGAATDVDLFVRRGTQATQQFYDCFSAGSTSSESCLINSPAAGDWYVMLHGYEAYSGLSLTATVATSGSTGTLNVTVNGLPGGAAAAVTVTGPAGFSTTATASRSITGLAAGTYTVAAAPVSSGGNTYTATPASQNVSVIGGGTSNATVQYATSQGLNLTISGMHITQATQTVNGSVPLVAGRAGLLRVFGTGTATGLAAPTVRVRIYRNGTLVDTRTLTRTGTVPATVDDGSLANSWNTLLPASSIVAGMSIVADIDPGNQVAESSESDNTFPANGTPLAMDVRTTVPFQARLVPVVQPNGLVGDVTEANKNTYTDLANALYPFPSIDADVRAPYNFSAMLPAAYDTVWSRLLSEIRQLRFTDGSSRYYYGVLKPSYNGGGTGLGYIGLPASIGVDLANSSGNTGGQTWRAMTAAHEWGHNFGRSHVGCGNPNNPDVNYPYQGGRLGVHGWDVRTNELRVLSSHFDLMSYCMPYWMSDYTYTAVLNFRGANGGITTAAPQPSLLVWGRTLPDGSVVLEPAFEVMAAPSLPSRPGRYRLAVTDAAGGTLFDTSFDGDAVDHMDGVRHFSFAVPLARLGGREAAMLRVSGAGAEAVQRRSAVAGGAGGAAAEDVRATRMGGNRMRLQWDVARAPMVMVRDPRTGAVLAFARGGDMTIHTSAPELELVVSDGVRSATRRVRPM